MAYSVREERWNRGTHGLATVLALVYGLWLMTLDRGLTPVQQVGLAAYALSLVVLFAASTAYHSVVDPTWQARLKRLDHMAIYVLIAGTYTPYLTITLSGDMAQALLLTVWLIAVFGVLFKIWFLHRFARLSLVLYLGMGWLSLVMISDLWTALPRPGFWWLLAGGGCFTLGAIFYAAKRFQYTHAIWHVFVAAGAACHAVSVGCYVIPSL